MGSNFALFLLACLSRGFALSFLHCERSSGREVRSGLDLLYDLMIESPLRCCSTSLCVSVVGQK